ncbi:DUF742 domain-containing protein [Actinoplanes subtropicus]|uniref:DUF742 domain-containing protein n=1 Tax=Actinoplanes subtropicus TaxID=543632 RepID=UPI000A036092|nr:DUF742 domain-containing protein [Actinoplanes subtropicus]
MSQMPWDSNMIPYAGAPTPARPADEPAYVSDEDPVVRPFMLTGGRTTPLHDGLRIETLLRAAPAALSAPLRFESRRVVELCQQPMSVADVAVGLRAPLGVTRVIVADLIADGYLKVEEQPGEISTALIERIRDRVRAL